MSTPRVTRYTREDYFPIGAFPLYLQRTPHEGDFHAHDHDFMELQLVLKGRGIHVTAAGAKTLEQGDVIVMRRELAWTLDDPLLRTVLHTPSYQVEARSGVLGRLETPVLKECERQLDALCCDLTLHPVQHPARKIAQLVLILDALGSVVKCREATPHSLPRRTAVLVDQASTLLESRLSHPWTSEALAKHLGLSPTYFVRIFKRMTGVPPLTYLATLRAERAAELLMRTDLSIEHIALEVGWGSSSYFARRFKEHFGLSAREYRTRFVWPGLDLAPGPRLTPRHAAQPLKLE